MMRKGTMTCRAGAVLLAGLTTVPVLANVYPSGLNVDTTNLNTTCGTARLTYYLNEDADGTSTLPGVKIEVLNEAGVAVRTVTFPAQKKGLRTFEWDGRDDSGNRVPDGLYSFRVTAADFGYSVWTPITDNNNMLTHFERPTGIAVNRNIDPVTRIASPYYGRIYVANPRDFSTVSGRPMGDGIYVMNADQSDALGQGNTALTGGLDFSGSTTSSPWRIKVGPDDNLYISDWSDLTGQLSRTSPDVTNGEQVLAGVGDTANPTVHGSIASNMAISGSIEGGDLEIWALDEDMGPPFQSLFHWNIGAGPLPHNEPPTRVSSILIGSVISVSVDMDRGPDGKFYLLQNRSDGNQPGLYVTDTDGATVLWDSLTETRALLNDPIAADLLRQSRTVAVAPDGSNVYVLSDQGNIRVLPLVDGIPQLAQMVTVNAFQTGTAQGAITVDAARNVYITSNIAERMRIYSPPDGPNSSTTATPPFSLNKSGSGGPMINTHPQDVALCSGETAVFSAAVTAGANATYQWKKNGINLVDGADVSGSQTTTLTLTSVPASDNGAALVLEVCDENGVTLSNPAFLNIGVRVLQPPESESVCVGGQATFNVMAVGNGPLSYQWERDTGGDNVFVPIGTDAPSVTLTDLELSDNNSQIRVVVTDSCGPVTSLVATLRVSDGPTIGGLSGSKTVDAGGVATYSVTAVGTGTISYQWRKVINGVSTNVGTNSPFLALSTTCNDNGASIQVDVTDDCGTKSAIVGGLTVNNPNPLPEICDNGIDDDCNGQTDCEDDACFSSPSCCNVPWADAEGAGGIGIGNGDGDVDLNDFAVFQLCYSGPFGTIPPSPAYCACFDRDQNNRIDSADFEAFKLCAGEGTRGAGVPGECP